MMMLWKEKKEPVLLIDPNRKRFLTVNSFDDKKSEKRNKFFFFSSKNTSKLTLKHSFQPFFQFQRGKTKQKTSGSFVFQQLKKKSKKKVLFFSMVDFFLCFFSTIEVIFSTVEILIDFFLSMVEIFDVFFNHQSYFFNGQCFSWFFFQWLKV